MKWFINLSTKNKLIVSKSLSILLLVIVAWFAQISLKESNQTVKVLYKQHFSDALTMSRIRYEQAQIRTNMTQLMLDGETLEQSALDETNHRLHQSISAKLAKIEQHNIDQPQRIAAIQEFNQIRNSFISTRQQEIIPAIQSGQMQKAIDLFSNVQAERADKMDALIEKLVTDIEADVSQAVTASDAHYGSALQVFNILVIIAIVMAVMFAIVLSRLLASPLTTLAHAATLIAKGDLTVSLPLIERTDESGKLLNAFRTMTVTIRDSMEQIREGANVLGAATSEITASSAQVSAGSAQTAAAISQTTATVEEVKQTAQLSAEKAKYVQSSAKQSAQAGLAGKKAMSETLESMELIQQQMEATAECVVHLAEQTQAIGDVIATVNELAEQSKLLAVNAALEAAKAGEQGKGFAVVAQEVKSLAEQSKHATVQVRSILGDIHKATNRAVSATEQGSRSVETGANLTRITHSSIDELMLNIDEAVNAAIHIAASAQQQLVGMDQVVLAMQNIEQASSQNVASTRQVETAAENLQTLGKKLILCVDQYQLQP